MFLFWRAVNLQMNRTVKYQGAFSRIVGFAGKRFLSPSPFILFFFCFRSNFPAITRLETLATQAKTKPVSKQANAKTLSSLQNLIYLFIYLCKDSRQGSFLSLGKLLTSSEAPKRRTPEIGIHNCVFTVCGLCKEWQLTKQLQFWIFRFTHIFFNVIREQSRTPTWLQLLLSHCDPKGLQFYGALCSWWLRLLY